jgi:hypothetical protein
MRLLRDGQAWPEGRKSLRRRRAVKRERVQIDEFEGW